MPHSIHQILFIGEIAGRSQQRIQTLHNLGIQTQIVANIPHQKTADYASYFSLLQRISYKLRFPLDSTKLNHRVKAAIHAQSFDLIFVEKSLVLKPKTLRWIKQKSRAPICWYSEDDMAAKHNQTYYFRKSIPYYDVMFTTKSFNCNPEELPRLGAKKVVLVEKSFDETSHHPMKLTETEKQQWGADVNFIGTFELQRANCMLHLAEQGIQVRIWGNGWQAWQNKHLNLRIENRAIYDVDYVKALCASKINLCFLRKKNRDLQTDRTMEIPACGAFMIAERTTEHLRLFTENKEAVYFDVDHPTELLEKVRYYLKNDTERQQIADAGRQRCLQSGYTHRHRLEFMLETVKTLSCVE